MHISQIKQLSRKTKETQTNTQWEHGGFGSYLGGATCCSRHFCKNGQNVALFPSKLKKIYMHKVGGYMYLKIGGRRVCGVSHSRKFGEVDLHDKIRKNWNDDGDDVKKNLYMVRRQGGYKRNANANLYVLISGGIGSKYGWYFEYSGCRAGGKQRKYLERWELCKKGKISAILSSLVLEETLTWYTVIHAIRF